jgi:hypothetical protein
VKSFLFFALIALSSPAAFADSVSVIINGATYSCTKGGSSVAQCECYNYSGPFYLVRVKQGDNRQDFDKGYVNLTSCIKAMKTEDQYKGICH